MITPTREFSGRHTTRTTSQFVIGSQEAFDEFVAGVPKNKIAKMSNAGESTNPILKNPEIDWKETQILVAQRLSFYNTPQITSIISAKNEGLTVTVLHKGAAQSDNTVSTFSCAVVPRVQGEIAFVVEEESYDRSSNNECSQDNMNDLELMGQRPINQQEGLVLEDNMNDLELMGQRPINQQEGLVLEEMEPPTGDDVDRYR
jgi:hypothetical protein